MKSKKLLKRFLAVLILSILACYSSDQGVKISKKNNVSFKLPQTMNKVSNLVIEVQISGGIGGCTLVYNSTDDQYECTIPNIPTGTYTVALTYKQKRLDYPDPEGCTFIILSKTISISTGANIADFTTGVSEDRNFRDDVDELDNFDEIVTYDTSPILADTDTDGMWDDWEVGYACLNPLLDDSATDFDGDLVSNFDESVNKTDPCSSATTACNDSIDNDGDGTCDTGSSDCDGDTSNDPADPGCTDANDTTETSSDVCDDNLDNDNDGLKDYRLTGGDPGCSGLGDTTEWWDAGGPECDDNIDNDSPTDGLKDRGGGDLGAGSADPECSSATDTTEEDVGGTWVELGDSATGGGVSNDSGNSYWPSLFLDSSGNPVVAWYDNSSGNYEIYVKKWQP